MKYNLREVIVLFMATLLEEVIKRHIVFNHRPNARGWLPVLCKVCNDHGRKGPRAAFLFTEEGVSYHCFNCSHTASYDAKQTFPLSEKMITLLNAFGVPEDEINEVNFQILKLADKEGTTIKQRHERKSVTIQPIAVPSFFHNLSDVADDNPWKQVAVLYLKEIRGIDPLTYPFMLSLKNDNPQSVRWDKRLIIPSFRDKELIFYEGRDLTEKSAKKYLSADVPKTNVFYGFDKLKDRKDAPLFITEGFFDAFLIDGVALFGNTLYKEIVPLLNSCPRQKVVIPDKRGDGYKLALQALKQGWSIATPEIPGCKDINEAIIRYGKLYVVRSIMSNIYSGFDAELNLQFYCEDYGKNK